MSPKLVDELIKNPSMLKLGGEKRVITVFFSDIEGFIGISEQMTPEELVALLNEYLTAMTDIILKFDGMVDKYEGDAIMAVWGAPIYFEDHAKKACVAALEMQEKLVGARSQGSNPWQTQVMALGVFCSSRIFLWTWSPLAAIKRPSV